MDVSNFENECFTRKQFGVLVQKHRKAKGYSQETFAELLGITQKSVSCIERGACFPSQENIFRIAALLNISLDEFVHGYKLFDGTITVKEINDLLNELTVEQKKIVVGTLHRLAGLLMNSGSKSSES